MIDKDHVDDSQVRCGSRESSIADDEEQKALLSSTASGAMGEVSAGLDPASQLDLVSDPNSDISESTCLVPATSLVQRSVSGDESEVTMNEIDHSSVNDSDSSLGPPSVMASVMPSQQCQNTSDAQQCPNSPDAPQCQNVSELPQNQSVPTTQDSQQCQKSEQVQTTDPPQQPTPLPQQCQNTTSYSEPNQLTSVPQTFPATSVTSQGQVATTLQHYPRMAVVEQGRPLIMSQDNSRSLLPYQYPHAFMPQQYYPMMYQYPPNVSLPQTEPTYLHHPPPLIARHGQPISGPHYPPQPSGGLPYYQPISMLPQYHAPTPGLKPCQTIPEGVTQQSTPALQHSQPMTDSQPKQNPPVLAQSCPYLEGQVHPQKYVLQHPYPTSVLRHKYPPISEGKPLQSTPAVQHDQPISMLQENQPNPELCPYRTPISEGQTHQPIPTSLGVFPNINPPPSSKQRAEMRLQGRHHLFTVVPVGSGDLKAAQEDAQPIVPAKHKLPPLSPLKHFIPTLATIMPTPPTTPTHFTFPNSKTASSHPLASVSPEEEPVASEADTMISSSSSQVITTSAVPTSSIVAKPTTTSRDSKAWSKKMSLPSMSQYHTITGLGSSQLPTRKYGIGGRSSSTLSFNQKDDSGGGIHPRGEYGVGALSLITNKREYGVGGLSRNPYHTITGMVSPTRLVREYGVGGSSSSSRADGTVVMPALSHRESITRGIPPSLVPVVLPDNANASPKLSGNQKQLSWGYSITAQKGNYKRSTSLRQLNQRWSTTHSPTIDECLSSPLLLPNDQVTLQSANQLTLQSTQQMTVHSTGGTSIGVGSTDGRSVIIVGALNSPEELHYLPALFRHGHLETCKSGRGAEAEKDGRQTWSNKAQFVLACIGYAVGLGNLWRFPYLCYKSGGGAFLIPYFVMLFVCGIPLLLMELAVGQFTRRGPIGAIEKLCPFFKGAGVGTVIMSFLLGTYYNVIIAWAIYYLFQSFTSELPWRKCDPSWAVNCFDEYSLNGTVTNGTKSATEEYFDEVVLQKSAGMGDMGSLRIELFLALLGAWILVYFCLWKSIKSSGKVVYVTATLPYLLIGAFLWRALTLPGAHKGLQYFFTPRWELLLEGKIWVAAAAQNFNSIGIAFGSLIAFSSYNKFNNNIILDTWAISLTNSFTSLLSGMIVFSTLGNIAFEQSKEMDEVVAEGPGLVFMVYPQALAKMPYGSIWAVLFFFMLLILGLDSQFANVEVIITSLQDGFPTWIKKNLKHHEILVLIVCLISFLCGLPNVMQGGIYFFKLIDYYAANISLMYLAFFEVVSVVWVYGAGRLAKNVQEMTGRMPSYYFRGCWYFAAPVLILAIWIFSLVDYERPTYNNGEYEYPNWAIGVGWAIASLSIIPIPIFAVIAVYKAKGTNLWEKFKNSFRSQIEECNCCGGRFNCEAVDQNGDEFLERPVKLVMYAGKEPENGEVRFSLGLDDENETNEETESNGKTN